MGEATSQHGDSLQGEKGEVNTMPGLHEVFTVQIYPTVPQPEVSYLVLARNGCDEFELVGDYAGKTVQKLCKGKHRSRDLTPS